MKSVRDCTELVCHSSGYPIRTPLPVLDSEKVVRSVDSIVKRIFAIHCAAASAYGFSCVRSLKWLELHNCIEFLALDERQLLETGQADRKAIAGRVESAYLLTWVVGHTELVRATEKCPTSFVKLMPNLKTDQSGEAFARAARLRDSQLILEQLDLYYCLHWHVVNDLLHDRPHPPGIEEYIIVNRRHALEWLCSPEDWDDIALDT